MRHYIYNRNMRTCKRIYIIEFVSGKSKMYNNPSEAYDDLKTCGLYSLSFVNLERSMYRNKIRGELTSIIKNVLKIEPDKELFKSEVDQYLSTINSNHPVYLQTMKNKYLGGLITEYINTKNEGVCLV